MIFVHLEENGCWRALELVSNDNDWIARECRDSKFGLHKRMSFFFDLRCLDVMYVMLMCECLNSVTRAILLWDLIKAAV
jgi:hypothetical protein